MRVVKCVVQSYTPSEEILGLLENFRLMLNECIRIGIRDNLTSMKSLSMKAYHNLARFDAYTRYRLTAISRATGLLRAYHKSLRKNRFAKIPYAKRLCLLDCYGFSIQGTRLRLTMRAYEYAYAYLNPHTLAAISGRALHSVTLTTRNLSIAYSREVDELVTKGEIGIDSNLNNVTIASSNGGVQTFDLSQATQIKETYRSVKSHLRRNDARIRRRVFGKFGTLQRNRVGWILNNISASIVTQAKERSFGIVIEDIKGIRKLYRKGNRQGRHYRSRLNSWSFHELQREIEYKGKMGRDSGHLCGSLGNKCDVLDMWEQDIPE